jgi:hypothetical protein
MSDAVLLPDGKVLVTGGAERGFTNSNSGDVLRAEIFDPDSELFIPMADATVPRHYYSTALLLPDGTVITAGNTGGFPPYDYIEEKRLESFLPSYLWQGPRPSISPLYRSNMQYNTSFEFTVGVGTNHQLGVLTIESIQRVAIIRLSSVTHANNMDQRYIILRILERHPWEWNPAVGDIQVLAPGDGAIAPPGWYMLFVISEHGVPSRGQFIHLG